MDKRWLLPIGLGVGVVVGVAATVAPGGRTVAGTASAAPVAPPPVVGDCLLGGPDGPFSVDPDTGDGLVAPYARSFGGCDGVRYGEVTAVVDGRARDIDSDGYPTGRLQADCDTALAEYVGAPDPVGISTDWWPSFAGGSFAVGPDPRQARSDQDWAACLIRPPYWGPGGREGQVGPDGYTTVGADSVRGGWDGSEVRNRLGYCYVTDPAGGVLGVYCGEPHDIETLAATYGDVTDAAELVETCRAAARRIVGGADVTFGGRITIAPTVLDGNGDVVAVTADTTLAADERVDCDARPTDPAQRLTATLAGRGDDPPPLEPR